MYTNVYNIHLEHEGNSKRTNLIPAIYRVDS